MTWRARLFGCISRLCVRMYGMLPIFGRLRGAIAVLPSGDRFVMIERSDGTGLCFPGGMVGLRESPENAVRREIVEETGMSVQHLEPWFDYRDDQLFPVHTFVFRAVGSGDPRSSWEGAVVYASLEEMMARIVVNQREVVSRLQQATA